MTDATPDTASASNSTTLAEPTDSIDTMYLTFPVGEELYGVSIAMVTEIVGLQPIMSVPDVPSYIKGVINLRGKVIPLMDVRLRFGIPEKAYDDRTVVIVMQVDDAPVGLIVDGVNEVLDVPDDSIDRAGSFAGDGARALVKGLARLEERVAILLDVTALLEAGDVTVPRADEVAA